jgi:hypothetical protein
MVALQREADQIRESADDRKRAKMTRDRGRARERQRRRDASFPLGHPLRVGA